MIPDNLNARATCTQLLSSFHTLKQINEGLNKRLSELDTEIANIYHTIECASLNPFQTHRVNLYLKHTLSQRRDVKNELSVLNSFLFSLDGADTKVIKHLDRCLKVKPVEITIQNHKEHLDMMLNFQVPDSVEKEVAATLEVKL